MNIQQTSEALKMAPRMVKAKLCSLYKRYGITDGVKRVKLATLLYRQRNN